MYEDCWYKEVCSQKDCTDCIRYAEMKNLVETSNLPKGRCSIDKLTLYPQDCDLEAFVKLKDIKDDIVGFVERGESLYIVSPITGNGKTTWAIKLMMKFFDSIWAGNGMRVRAIFVNVPTLLNKMKQNISVKDPKVEELLQRLPTVDLVVWDDICGAQLSQYDYSQLLSFIDERVVNGKANIYTGNTLKEEMPRVVGDRLTSRIWNLSTIIEFYGEDRR